MPEPTPLSSQPAPVSARTHEAFEALLMAMLQHPERRAQLSEQVLATFSVPKAVLVLDMSGFSRTTRLHGIVTFLLMIYQMRKLCEPVVNKHQGILVKAEADNLFCLFDDTAAALRTAREIMQRLEAANCVLPEGQQLYASIGIGYGQTLYVGEEDLFGDEVNLASKLGEDLAESGEILLTCAAADQMPEEKSRSTPREVSISGLSLSYWKAGI